MGSSGALKVLYKACRCCHRQTFYFYCEKLQIAVGLEEIKKDLEFNTSPPLRAKLEESLLPYPMMLAQSEEWVKW